MRKLLSSYSRADGRHAVEIDSVLRDKGLKSFFDHRNLDAGPPWVWALEKAMGSAADGVLHATANDGPLPFDRKFVGH